jgi:hypothetical protein
VTQFYTQWPVRNQFRVRNVVNNAGQNLNIKINNKYFERVEQFTYLGTNLTDQNSIEEEIKSKLKSGSAC